MPCFRDPDNLVYGKSEHGGMLFGGYEAEPTARWIDGVPWEHAATSLPPDYERFAPLMAGAIRRFPFLADAEAIRLVCHPDAMTPDANPLLGPMPGLRGLLGRCRPVAQRIRRRRRDRPGARRLDHGRRPGRRRRARTGPGGSPTPTAIPAWSAALARETYADYYRLRYPYDADEAGRPRRLSRAPRPAPGSRRRLRHEGRLGAGGPPPTRRSRGAAPGATSAPTAGRVRRGSSGSARSTARSANGSG